MDAVLAVRPVPGRSEKQWECCPPGRHHSVRPQPAPMGQAAARAVRRARSHRGAPSGGPPSRAHGSPLLRGRQERPALGRQGQSTLGGGWPWDNCFLLPTPPPPVVRCSDVEPVPLASAQCSTSEHLTTDRKSTRLNSSHTVISYAVFCLKKKKKTPHSYPSVNSRCYYLTK